MNRKNAPAEVNLRLFHFDKAEGGKISHFVSADPVGPTHGRLGGKLVELADRLVAQKLEETPDPRDPSHRATLELPPASLTVVEFSAERSLLCADDFENGPSGGEGSWKGAWAFSSGAEITTTGGTNGASWSHLALRPGATATRIMEAESSAEIRVAFLAKRRSSDCSNGTLVVRLTGPEGCTLSEARVRMGAHHFQWSRMTLDMPTASVDKVVLGFHFESCGTESTLYLDDLRNAGAPD
jgi:hypothetical protein